MERHTQALSIFEELEDRRGIASTLDLLGMANLLGGNLRTSRQHYERVLPVFEELNDRMSAAHAMGTFVCHGGSLHTDACEPTESLARVLQEAEGALQVARSIGWRSCESFCLWNLAMCLAPLGDYMRAIQSADTGLLIAQEIEHSQWITFARLTRGAVALEIYDIETAKDQLQQAVALAQATRSALLIGLASSGLGAALTAAGELDEAESLLLSALRTERPWTMAQRQVRASWAELALAQGRFEEALQRVEALDDEVNHGDRIARLSRTKGRALAGLGRLDEAETVLRSTLEMCEREGRLSALWRLHADLTGVTLKRGDAEAAAGEAQAAKSLVDRLAEGVPDEQQRQTYLAKALETIPGLPRPRPAAEPRGLLSQREREVAAMVARGLSNRAMADILVLSERTVESHVANALSKLGFSSRAQLAAWAVEQGIA